MLYIFWEFRVRPGKVAEFERRYGSDGDWAALFRRAPGFNKTILGRDRESANHYLVTDIWDDAESFSSFKKDFREAYEQLDKLCEQLTTEEKRIGNFEVV